MTHNLIVPLVIITFPFFVYSYKFIAVNAYKEEKNSILGGVFLVSLVISIIIKLFFLEKAPSFFGEIGGIIISFCLVFMILTLFLFLIVVCVRITDKALSP